MKKIKKLKLNVDNKKLKLKFFFFCFWLNIDLDSEFPVLHIWQNRTEFSLWANWKIRKITILLFFQIAKRQVLAEP